MESITGNLNRIKNLVQEYYDVSLIAKGRDLKLTTARWVFLQLVDDVYKINCNMAKLPLNDKLNKPDRFTIATMIGVNQTNIILRYFVDYVPTQQAKKDLIKLRNHIADIIDGKYNQHQIKEMLIENKLILTDVIDAVIDVNSLIGVGLISLGDGLKEYCYNKIKK